MDKLEKVIKKIEEYLREEKTSFCLVRSTFLWNIRKLLKEQQPKWIPVEERLPEIKKGCEYLGTRYITCDKYKQVIPLRYCRHTVRGKEVCRWTYDDGRLYYGTVVAWMPLPEPPKEGEADG